MSKFARFIKLSHVVGKSSRPFEAAFKLRCTKQKIKEALPSFYRKLLLLFLYFNPQCFISIIQRQSKGFDLHLKVNLTIFIKLLSK